MYQLTIEKEIIIKIITDKKLVTENWLQALHYHMKNIRFEQTICLLSLCYLLTANKIIDKEYSDRSSNNSAPNIHEIIAQKMKFLH